MDFEAFFRLSYGLYIITSIKDGKKNGYIANTAFQVTATPPQIGISVNKENYTHGLIVQSGIFGLSVLTEKASMDVIQTFGYKSGKETDKFAKVEWKTTIHGLPVVATDCCASFECKVVSSWDIGTHTFFIGEVLNSEMIDPDATPLTYSYYREVFKARSPQRSPTYISENNLRKTRQSAKHEIYVCQICHYEYDPALGDPDSGIPPGTSFEDLPDDWECPICGARKEDFKVLDS